MNNPHHSNVSPAPGVSASDPLAAAIREAGRFGYEAGLSGEDDPAKVFADVALLLIRHVADEFGDLPAGEALLNFAAGYMFGAKDWQPFDPGDRA